MPRLCRYLCSLICCLASFLVASAGWAKDASSSAALRSPQSAQTVPLAMFIPTSGPLMLRHSNGAATVSLPLAARLAVQSAFLRVVYTNSVTLLEARSQLRISLNDVVLAQVPLNPKQPEGQLDIRLPVSLLHAQYNRLTFQVAQHYTQGCEDPSAPELWTQIDTTASTLTFETALRPVRPLLSELAQLIDPKLWGEKRLHIMTTGTLHDAHLRWGALIAQGAALRLRYTPVQVTHSTARRVETPLAGGAVAPGLFQEPEVAHDQVLVGTRAELAPYLSTAMQEQITESFVGIYPGDRDPRYVLLVISGRDEAEVTRAAMAFASLNFPFPEAPSMLVPALQLPTLPPYTAKWQVHANGRYPLHEFGVKTASFQGMYTGQVRFEVSVAPDSFVYEDSVVELKFHLAYGAGLRRDSVLNIWLNDIFMAAIPLDKAEGAVYRDYAVRLPARALQAGRNTFRFTPHMMPLLSGECIAVQDANLVLTVFDDTLLVLPNATHYARLPELALFARTGFPATIVPDGTDLAVQVAGEDSATLAAAWMLLGKLAQKVEMPLYHTTFSFQPPAQPKHRLVVGTLAHLDPQLLAAAPVRLGTVSQVPYPTLPPRLPEERSRTMVERWLRALGERFQVAAPAERRRPDLVQMLQQSALGPWTLAMMFATPSQAPQTTVLFVAAEPTSLWRGMQRGVEAAFWENLQGDVVLWGDTPASLAWQRAGTTYHLGDIGLTSRLEYYASHYPWFWSILTIVLLGLFAYLTRMLLRRFQRRHHGDLAVEEVLETPSV